MTMKGAGKRIFALILILALLYCGAVVAEDNSESPEEINMEDLLELFELIQYQHDHYYELAQPELPLERKYTPLGAYDVGYAEYDVQDEALQNIPS